MAVMDWGAARLNARHRPRSCADKGDDVQQEDAAVGCEQAGPPAHLAVRLARLGQQEALPVRTEQESPPVGRWLREDTDPVRGAQVAEPTLPPPESFVPIVVVLGVIRVPCARLGGAGLDDGLVDGLHHQTQECPARRLVRSLVSTRQLKDGVQQLRHEAEVGRLPPDEQVQAELVELLRCGQPHPTRERAHGGGHTGIRLILLWGRKSRPVLQRLQGCYHSPAKRACCMRASSR
eukprot:scaffold3837_cov110-Isochrysis_galbana.AAC.11